MKLHDIFQIVCREKFLILMAWLRRQTRFMQEPSEQCSATFLTLRETENILRFSRHQFFISKTKFDYVVESSNSKKVNQFLSKTNEHLYSESNAERSVVTGAVGT